MKRGKKKERETDDENKEKRKTALENGDRNQCRVCVSWSFEFGKSWFWLAGIVEENGARLDIEGL